MIELPHIIALIRASMGLYEIRAKQRASRLANAALSELENYMSMHKDPLTNVYVREVTTSGPIVRLRLVARADGTDSCEGCYYEGIKDLCEKTHAKTAWPQCTKHIWMEESND